jgi:hypothetical protein
VPFGHLDHNVIGVKEPGSVARDHEYVVLPCRREDLHGALVLKLPRLEPGQSVHPVLCSLGGELPGKLPFGEEDADRGKLATDLGLLKNVPSTLVYQPVKGRTR